MFPDCTGIRSLNTCPGDSISVFNDAPGRTLQEIFDPLDKTRIGLEEKGQ